MTRARPSPASGGCSSGCRNSTSPGWSTAARTSPGSAASRRRRLPDTEIPSRPCPWVGCKHHLYLDVSAETGSVKIAFPDLEPWELKHSCSLDVAAQDGITLEETGRTMNVTRERIRQLESRGLRILERFAGRINR